jgi:hypothetical protein
VWEGKGRWDCFSFVLSLVFPLFYFNFEVQICSVVLRWQGLYFCVYLVTFCILLQEERGVFVCF